MPAFRTFVGDQPRLVRERSDSNHVPSSPFRILSSAEPCHPAEFVDLSPLATRAPCVRAVGVSPRSVFNRADRVSLQGRHCLYRYGADKAACCSLSAHRINARLLNQFPERTRRAAAPSPAWIACTLADAPGLVEPHWSHTRERAKGTRKRPAVHVLDVPTAVTRDASPNLHVACHRDATRRSGRSWWSPGKKLD